MPAVTHVQRIETFEHKPHLPHAARLHHLALHAAALAVAHPDGYQATSALTHAAKLARPLLLIHGLTDDNVHLAHTLALIEALYIAAKRAEVITLSATHMVPDPRLNLAREQVQVEFFRQHLGTP